jgi:hypothetical protein
MTAASGRPPTPLDIAKHHVERAFGPKVAKRLDTFKDGTFYITAGDLARLLAWLVDFVVFLLLAGAGLAAVAVAYTNGAVSGGMVALIMLGLLVVVPVLYGLCYGNGRALGAVLTGTRLVRFKNGHRLGTGACWAMLVRTVLCPPILLAISLGQMPSVGSARRISIDDAATRQLHAAGFLRLDTSGSVAQPR